MVGWDTERRVHFNSTYYLTAPPANIAAENAKLAKYFRLSRSTQAT